MRTDIRWPDDAAVTRLLAGIPRSHRAHVIRSIVEAALVPGGWARLVDGAVQPSTPPEEPRNTKPVEVLESAPSGPSMSPAARSSFREALQQFGTDLSGNH